MFERFKARLRQLRSLGSFSRKEWRFGTKLVAAEEAEEKILQKVEADVAEISRINANEIQSIENILNSSKVDIEQLKLRHKELRNRLQSLVTNCADLMQNNFSTALSLLEEFERAIDLLKASMERKEKTIAWKSNPLLHQERQDYRTLIELCQEEFDKLFKEITQLKYLVQADLEAAAYAFRTMHTRVVSADITLASPKSLPSIVQSDLQQENVYLRNIQNFRSSIKSFTTRLNAALKESEKYSEGLHHKDSAGNDLLQRCLDILSSFEQAYLDLFAEIRKVAAVEYHQLNAEIKNVITLYDRIEKAVRDMDRAKRNLRDTRSADRMLAELALLNRELQDASSVTSTKVTAVASRVKNETASTQLKSNFWRTATAALLLFHYTVPTVAGIVGFPGDNKSKTESVMVMPSQQERAHAQEAASHIIEASRQAPLFFIWGQPQLQVAQRIHNFSATIAHELQTLDKNKFDISLTVKGWASADHAPEKARENAELAAKRATAVAHALQQELAKENLPITVQLAETAGEVQQLPAQVTFAEARDAAAKANITHEAMTPREKEIEEKVLSPWRRVDVEIHIKEKATQKEIVTQDQEWQHPLWIPLAGPQPVQPAFVGGSDLYPKIETQFSMPASGQRAGDKRMGVTVTSFTDLQNMFSNLQREAINKANLLYRNAKAEGKSEEDALAIAQRALENFQRQAQSRTEHARMSMGVRSTTKSQIFRK